MWSSKPKPIRKVKFTLLITHSTRLYHKNLESLNTIPSFLHSSIRSLYGNDNGPGNRPFFRKTITSVNAGNALIFVSETVATYCQNRSIICGIDATFKVGGAYQLFGVYILLKGTVRNFLYTIVCFVIYPTTPILCHNYVTCIFYNHFYILQST